jgi:DNA invertase Pin-like site-specific DNA recombinase
MAPTSAPYAYLRKSVIRRDEKTISPETQEREVRRLADFHGDNHGRLLVLADWDVSGRRESTNKRVEWLRLVEAIKAGDVTAVYSYSLSRLSRSSRVLLEFFDLCKDRGVPIRLAYDRIDTSTASGQLVATMLAAMAQFESDVASERVTSMYETKRANGEEIRTRERYGERDGQDAQAVLDAYREAGSFSGAARLLNERGVKPRDSERGWWSSSVAVVVKRLDPTIKSPGRGKRTPRQFILARLLQCPACGSRLTGSRLKEKNGGRRTRYACRFAESKPHPRSTVTEKLVLPAIQAEVAHLRTPEEVEIGDDEKERADLERRRMVVLDMAESGDIDRAERQRRLMRIGDAVAKLDGRRMVEPIPPVDWSWPPERLNAVLRAMFTSIQLDPNTFQPVAFEWTVPEWRARRARPSGKSSSSRP